MKVFLLDNCRSRSWSRSRKHNFFSAPAPAKNYGSGRLRLRNTGFKYDKLTFLSSERINHGNERYENMLQ